MKTFKKLLSLLLAGVMTLSLLAAVPFTAVAVEGDIDWTASTITLDSPEDLLAFATQVQSNADLAWKTIQLGADIDMAGRTWTPIARARRFTFDGQGYAIKNLSVSGDTMYIAMFDRFELGTMKNISFINASVTSNYTSTYPFTAVIAARTVSSATFENVYVNGNVRVESRASSTTSYKAGGFVAEVSASCTTTFKNCVSDCSIYASNTFGGFVGFCAKGATTKMENCVFTGWLKAGKGEFGGWIGRLVGNAEFTRCLMLGRSDSGSWGAETFYLHNNNFGGDTALPDGGSTVKLVDCYVAPLVDADSGHAINGSSYFNLEISYTGESEPAYTVAYTSTVDVAAASNAVKQFNLGPDTLATYLRDHFKSEYPALAGVMVAANNQSVSYADGKSITKLLPKTVHQLLVNVDLAGVQFSEIDQTAKTYDIRFVGTLNTDYLNHAEKIGFAVTATYMENGEETSMDYRCEGNLIYTSIVETVGTTLKPITAESLKADYLYAFAITDIPTTVGDITFRVQPYVIADGKSATVGGVPRTITVTYSETDGLVADYSVID